MKKIEEEVSTTSLLSEMVSIERIIGREEKFGNWKSAEQGRKTLSELAFLNMKYAYSA